MLYLLKYTDRFRNIEIYTDKEVRESYWNKFEEYINELNKKLQEETNEYLEDNNVEELADIVEVIYAILDLKNVSIDEFETIRKSKVEKRGAFKNKIFLEKEEC